MKVTLGKIVETRQVLASLAAAKMEPKGAYAIARNLELTAAEFTSFEAGRKTIVDQYFADENGQPVCKDQAGADREFMELVSIEVELEPYKINLDYMGNEKIIEPASMMAILWMVKDA